MLNCKKYLALVIGLFLASFASAQELLVPNLSGLNIDKEGTLRWKSNQQEALFFGVNYTLPFAYAYRSHLKLGLNHKAAIDKDVYHFARLGLNAFRIHVWDTEISDSLGNLKNNVHLDLFDYLVAQLEKRGIYSLITPIAFWGNGYPDADENTGSFSWKYGKKRAVTEEAAFLAQENYLKQFFNHVNPYTGRKYKDDPFVVATEINNEPNHTGALARCTEYINRMRKAILSTGWQKPVFYNISESPAFASAVATADVDGFSFQWYPTGLVAGHELKGNFLPNVDTYRIPFDTIPAFHKKPRIIYEFDAADVMQPLMYPAMARSFRAAGFQWATQFAYDPLGTAFSNTEYQTHFLNLAYTPAKAISLMIAAKAFCSLPSGANSQSYPADSVFGNTRLSYKQQLSEWISEHAFLYAASTSSRPKDIKKIKQIAGVGSSCYISYPGNGAYFLDKLAEGVWRLELMPDVQQLQDPFAKYKLTEHAIAVLATKHLMTVNLPDLGKNFSVSGLNKGNTASYKVVGGKVNIQPGVYILKSAAKQNYRIAKGAKIGTIRIDEFVAPLTNKVINPTKEAAIARSAIWFDPSIDRNTAIIHSQPWDFNSYQFESDNNLLRFTYKAGTEPGIAAIEGFVKEKIKLFDNNAARIIISLKASKNTSCKIALVDTDGQAYSKTFFVTGAMQVEIPLVELRPDDALLLPRPYPGFQPLYFKSSSRKKFNLAAIEKFQLSHTYSGSEDSELWIGNIDLNP